jgi:wyosine [tRNA(Phe)-imidazoG37] synthetase (radical SAM superfamily)
VLPCFAGDFLIIWIPAYAGMTQFCSNGAFGLNNKPLSTINHDRDSAALRYVYPVISRRAGGVSVGINLNTNNACNWHCIYCQVPDLIRGTAPPVDLAVLEHELRDFLNELLHGDFMQNRVPEESRRITDIALSGNGEPTSSAEFVQVIALIARVRREVALPETVKTVLITNGSLLSRSQVQQGVVQTGSCQRRRNAPR